MKSINGKNVQQKNTNDIRKTETLLQIVLRKGIYEVWEKCLISR